MGDRPTFRRVRLWLERLVRSDRFDRDLDDELTFHLRAREDHWRALGLTASDARRRARLEFGGVDKARAEIRDARRGARVERIGRDVRYAARGLRRSPGFTASVVLTFALGIGATTTVFSVVYGVLLRPLPFPNADRLVSVGRMSARQLDVWRELSTTTSAVALHARTSRTLTSGGDPARLMGVEASAALFDILGTPPILGRHLASGDDVRGAEPVVVLAHDTWVSRMGADADIVDRRVMLDGRSHRVVGVMPPGFGFPSLAGRSTPLDSEGRSADAPEFWVPFLNDEPYDRYRAAIALLRAGVSIEEASAEGEVIVAAMPGVDDVKVAGLAASLTGDARSTLVLFQAGVVLVLLIACANAINLLLARAAHRRPEVSIRAALGATRAQLACYAVAEALLPALAGGAIGCVAAFALMAGIRTLPPYLVPRLSDVRVDGAVLLFGCALSIAAGVVVGLVAAFRTARADLRGIVHGRAGRERRGGSGRQRPSSVLVVGEIAAAFVLLACAGLLLRSFVHLTHVDPGVKPDGVLTLRVTLPAGRYPTQPARVALADELQEAVKAVPRVQSVAMTTDGNVIGSSVGTFLRSVDGVEVPQTEFIGTWLRYVSEDFFDTLGIPILQGRGFMSGDRAGRSAVVVSDAFARRHFGVRDPVGRFVDNRTIIGVAGDVLWPPTVDRPEVIYLLPTATDEPGIVGTATDIVVLVRADGDALALVPALRRTIARLDAELAAYDVTSLEQFLDRSYVSPRFYGRVSTAFAGVALALAAVGLYGLLAYSVATRRQEIGVRMALGAQATGLVAGVVRQGLTLSAAGIVIGLAGAYAASRALEALIFGIAPHDPVTFAGAAVVFTAIGAIACYIPARRAARVDPVLALRSE